ncbi:MAG: hypothetical protein ACP5UD_07560 [Conexivisphaera sp.]
MGVGNTRMHTSGNNNENTRDWREDVDVSALGRDARRAILSALRERMGTVELSRALGVSRVALWRYLRGRGRSPTRRRAPPPAPWRARGPRGAPRAS